MTIRSIVPLALLLVANTVRVQAQPTVLEPGLAVRTVVSGLTTPIGIAFLGPTDLLVLEKNTGQVKHVVDSVVQSVVLDLAVNSASERGLLGVAIDPLAPTDVYLYWTESSTGIDTSNVSEVPLRGNRVDRFVWNGSLLTFDANLLRLRARQTDNVPVPGHEDAPNAVESGNHDGGVLAFGPDGRLYVFVGDVGRRGQMQNLPTGPFPTPPFVDDTFGGPEPDDAHLTGVVLRIGADGSTPADNPFFGAGAAIGGEVGANVQRLFSYGHRNGFGMAFDPFGSDLWLAENGDDAFSELNRVPPGSNGGWIQVMGPIEWVAEFRDIETTFAGGSLQQVRWPPSNIATTPDDALLGLFVLPGASYVDPVLSWLWEVAPGGLGFVASGALGAALQGDLVLGAATANLSGGYLFRLDVNAARTGLALSDPRLADGVADNLAKHDGTESEGLLFGTDFGSVTDVETGPNGNLFVVSLTHGAVYEIHGTAIGLHVPAMRQQLRCQSGTGKALARFVRAKTRCVTKCLAAARRAGGPFADCLPPYGGETAACIEAADTGAEAKAGAKIAHACARDCPACFAVAENCPAGAAYVAEAEAELDARLPAVFCVEAAATAPTRPEARCEDQVAKRLAKFLGAKSKCLARCAAGAFQGKVDAAACTPGAVTDLATLDCIAKAESGAVAAITQACAAAPACHAKSAAGWVASVEAEVDARAPALFCGG